MSAFPSDRDIEKCFPRESPPPRRRVKVMVDGREAKIVSQRVVHLAGKVVQTIYDVTSIQPPVIVRSLPDCAVVTEQRAVKFVGTPLCNFSPVTCKGSSSSTFGSATFTRIFKEKGATTPDQQLAVVCKMMSAPDFRLSHFNSYNFTAHRGLMLFYIQKGAFGHRGLKVDDMPLSGRVVALINNGDMHVGTSWPWSELRLAPYVRLEVRASLVMAKDAIDKWATLGWVSTAHKVHGQDSTTRRPQGIGDWSLVDSLQTKLLQLEPTAPTSCGRPVMTTIAPTTSPKSQTTSRQCVTKARSKAASRTASTAAASGSAQPPTTPPTTPGPVPRSPTLAQPAGPEPKRRRGPPTQFSAPRYL